MILFTADQHFSHENMIDYAHRPYNRVGQMNHDIIRKYRSVVGDDDIVYFLGDVSIVGPNHRWHLQNLIDQLSGTKILILGNHDKFDPFTYVDMGFQSVHTSFQVEEFHLTHDPAICQCNTSVQWLCGHIHTLFKKQNNVLNVGVDVWGFYPVTINEVRGQFNG